MTVSTDLRSESHELPFIRVPTQDGCPGCRQVIDLLGRWRPVIERFQQEAKRETEMAKKLTAYGSSEGSSSGATKVEVVPAPLAGITRKIRAVYVHNADTVAQVVNLAKRKVLVDRNVGEDSLNAGVLNIYFSGEDYIDLDDTDESLILFLDGAVTTNELDFNAVWEDYEM